jgi:Leucine-rich repeat (LRR) protein
MNRQWKDLLLFDDDEIYAEAKRRIEECGEKKAKKLNLSTLDLKEIPPEITELQSLEELYMPCLSLERIP